MTTDDPIRAAVQAKLPAPIEHYGVFMTKGSFTKAPSNAVSDGLKILGGIRRKKRGGDLTGVSTSGSAMGLDNHQTVLALAGGTLYAVDMTTSMGGTRTVGDVLGSWPADELVVEGTRKQQGKAAGHQVVLLNLDISHPPSGQGGQMETMSYEDLPDPSFEFFEVLIAL